MSIATGVTTRCSRAGAQVMRQGLAADAVDNYRAGALLLRGSPFAVGWFAGWLSAEFFPQVVKPGLSADERMVELGWICVPMDYSKSPSNRWPAHMIDVKRATAWVPNNIADYGGDLNFIAVTGGSAGGHLSVVGRAHCKQSTVSAGIRSG